jgi:hypothetical protein
MIYRVRVKLIGSGPEPDWAGASREYPYVSLEFAHPWALTGWIERWIYGIDDEL